MSRLLLPILASIVLAACGPAPDPASTTAAGGPSGSGSGGSAGAGGGGNDACTPSFEGDTVQLAAATSIAPGQEQTMCLRWTTPDALDISSFVGTLGPGGHHALLLSRGGGTEPDGLSPCEESELMDAATYGSFQMLAGVSYESDGMPVDFPSVPVQVGLSVPAGTQLIFDAHFLNSGPEAIDACARLDLSRGKPVVAKLQFRTVLPTEQYTLSVLPHSMLDVAYEEPTGGHFRIAAASSHMHAGGTHFRMSIKETDKTLHETTQWADPKPTIFDSEIIVADDGQTFKIECSFDNMTSAPQHFPDQMCVGAMYVLPCTLPGAC